MRLRAIGLPMLPRPMKPTSTASLLRGLLGLNQPRGARTRRSARPAYEATAGLATQARPATFPRVRALGTAAGSWAGAVSIATVAPELQVRCLCQEGHTGCVAEAISAITSARVASL